MTYKTFLHSQSVFIDRDKTDKETTYNDTVKMWFGNGSNSKLLALWKTLKHIKSRNSYHNKAYYLDDDKQDMQMKKIQQP